MTRATTHHTTPVRRALAALGLAVLLATSAAACGASPDDNGAAAADDEVASLDDAASDTTSDTSDTTDDTVDAATDDTTDDTAAAEDEDEDDENDESDEPVDMEETMLEFAQCMRDHGVDYPDPDVSGSGPVAIQIGGDPNDPNVREADEACHPLLEEMESNFTPPDPEEMARMQEQMLEFAECMREHGVDFPDPVMDDNGMISISIGAEAGEPGTDGANDDPDTANAPMPFDDPAFKAAQEACGNGGPMMVGGGQ